MVRSFIYASKRTKPRLNPYAVLYVYIKKNNLFRINIFCKQANKSYIIYLSLWLANYSSIVYYSKRSYNKLVFQIFRINKDFNQLLETIGDKDVRLFCSNKRFWLKLLLFIEQRIPAGYGMWLFLNTRYQIESAAIFKMFFLHISSFLLIIFINFNLKFDFIPDWRRW